jgi:AcrR family transcriptional regulator
VDPASPPTGKAQATRARLIDSAAESFVDAGFGAMSVRDLAERSKLTTGAIYGHFRSKANLLGEAVRLRITRDLEQRGRSQYGETRLAEYLAHSFRDYPNRHALRALLVEGAAAARIDDDVRQLLHDVVLAKQQEWAALYRDVWENEGLDPHVDAEAVMVFMWAAELGLGVLEALDIELPAPRTLSEIVRRLVGALSRRD